MEVFPQLFHKNSIKTVFDRIEYGNENIQNKLANTTNEDRPQTVYSFKLIPDYVKLHLRNSNYKVACIPQNNKGYAIFLKEETTVTQYMQTQFNSKKRNIINRYVKRLEHCFDITYKLYHGAITKKDYHDVMQALFSMIQKRFEERNEIHKNSNEQQYLLDTTYDKIQTKKASLFVIYNKNQPIEISLNYHFDKILFSYISSYHIDYSKFGLGHVEIYKQVDWCAKNGYVLFEMGVGGMDYKRRWSNKIYQYNQYIAYKQDTFINTTNAKVKINIYRIKEFLKSKGINEIIPKLKARCSKRHRVNSKAYHRDSIVKTDMLENNILDFKQIDLNNNQYTSLKRVFNDFLYTTQEHQSKAVIYQTNQTNTFLISSPGFSQKIHITSI